MSGGRIPYRTWSCANTLHNVALWFYLFNSTCRLMEPCLWFSRARYKPNTFTRRMFTRSLNIGRRLIWSTPHVVFAASQMRRRGRFNCLWDVTVNESSSWTIFQIGAPFWTTREKAVPRDRISRWIHLPGFAHFASSPRTFPPIIIRQSIHFFFKNVISTLNAGINHLHSKVVLSMSCGHVYSLNYKHFRYMNFSLFYVDQG